MKMLLQHYLDRINLPNLKILGYGEVSDLFLKRDILTLWDAIEYTHNLPYSRTTQRDNYLQVLQEKRGACSVKHALISELAKELRVPLHLTLGIFFLTAENMPAIKQILKDYDLTAVPEAHCYLKYENSTLDITFPDSTGFSFDARLEKETYITSKQIGTFKVDTHQNFIHKWIEDKPLLTFDLVWSAREQWIRQLSSSNQ